MLKVSEEYINQTRGYRFGGSEVYTPFTQEKGKLFLAYQREFGRCTGRTFIDGPNGEAKPIGWCFEKKMRYEDARTRKPSDFYIREVWVTLHETKDE